MSDLERSRSHAVSRPEDQPEEPSRGPNLTLLYSLIALAILVAIGFAALIVLPFYRRR